MKKLGDLALPDSLQWSDQFEWSPVSQEIGRTLGGAQIVWPSSLHGGRPITLEAEDDATWLSMAQTISIMAMAAQSGGVFTLEWESESFNVMFRHQDVPAVSLKPIRPHAPLYAGTIKLMEV